MPVMRLSQRIVLVAAAVLLSVARPGIEARQARDAPGSLALTPGTVALLANQLNAAAVPVLRAALVHQDPTVRAVAARVAGVAKAADLADGSAWRAGARAR